MQLRAFHLALSITFLTASSAPTLAQQLIYPTQRIATPMDSSLATAPCSLSLAGEFTGDRVADVITLSGEDALLVHAPALYGGVTVLASDVTDIEHWDGPASDRESVLLGSLTAGVRIATWYATSQGAPGDCVIEEIDGLENVRARRLCRLDADGDGDPEIAVCGADGASVAIYGAFGATFADDPCTFATAGTVRDLAGLEWDTTLAGDELAVLSTAGLEVLTAIDVDLATACFTDLRPGADPLMAIVRDDPSRHRVAWITSGAAPGERVFVVSDSRGSEPASSLGSTMIPVALVAAQMTSEAPSVIFASHTFNHTLSMCLPDPLATPPTTPTYAPTPAQLSFIALAPAEWTSFETNVAEPAIADFDNDGDMDLWFPLADHGDGVVYPSPTYSECAQRPLLTGAVRNDARDPSVLIDLTLTFEAPASAPSGSVDTLEYLIWRRASSNSVATLVAMSESSTTAGEATVALPLDEALDAEDQFFSRYYVQSRFVGPSYVGPFATHSVSGNQSDLLADIQANGGDQWSCTPIQFVFPPFDSNGGGETAANPFACSPAALQPFAESIGGVIPRPRPPSSGSTTPTTP